MKGEKITGYEVVTDDVTAKIEILKTEKDFVPIYNMTFPKIEPATMAVLDSIREKMVVEMEIKPIQIMRSEETEMMKKKFLEKSLLFIREGIPHLSKDNQKILAGILLHNSMGLGPIEILLNDPNLEEIVVNGSKEPIWVYHIRLGWLKTNITPPSEVEVYNYAALIGRRVGTQITNLNPLMDAYLTSGDRANATLFPISSGGNTLSIRKFTRKAWTITDFIENKTLSTEMAALIWLAMQYELNILITGGTASGKTALLNVLSCFIPPSHRIISIEDTREMHLPDFLHWVPLTTRPPNPEGKGEVTMLDLMINSLRMRPDRIVVGEIRRSKEAEVLFEAIHTGHSVYSTLHANTDEETLKRLTNPPLDIPPSLLSSMQLVVVMHRDRRKKIRRVLSISELVESRGEELKLEIKRIFEWSPLKDVFNKVGRSTRVLGDIKLFSGMSDRDIQKDISNKEAILKWMVKQGIRDVNKVGRIISEYYVNPEKILKEAGLK